MPAPPIRCGSRNCSEFQSAPGREAGRCVAARVDRLKAIGFNPRPAVRPGDAELSAELGAVQCVSIRARP